MALFSPAEAEKLAAATVRVATLVDFNFADTPVYCWNGFGQRVFAGKTYLGVGDIGQIDGLAESRTAQSSQVTFTLSGVPDSPADLLAKAINSADVVQGRLVIVSLQLFDEAWNAFSNPIAIYFGIMQQPQVTREAATTEVGARRTLKLTAENLFYGRVARQLGDTPTGNSNSDILVTGFVSIPASWLIFPLHGPITLGYLVLVFRR